MLEILTGETNKTLREKSVSVTKIDSSIKKLIKEMVKSMGSENGVGLAAPQVGSNIRVIIARLNPGEGNEIIVAMVNPEIASCSEEKEAGEEGCLSLPGMWGQVVRSREIIVRFTSQKGQDQTLKMEALNARIVQHEIDHLDGVLFVDKATGIHEKKMEIDDLQI